MRDDEPLADVLRNPDDVVARFRYALWCDAQPEPSWRARGDFIRLQIELAEVLLGRAQGNELALRLAIDRLSDRWAGEWAAALRQLVQHVEFHRGFVELVALSADEFIGRAEALFALAPIRHLDVTTLDAPVEALLDSPYFPRLRSLSLDGAGATDREMFALARSPRLRGLRWLSVAQNGVTQSGALALAESPYLDNAVYVAFHGNPFQPNERYSYDDGFVVDSWLPEEGVALEQQAERPLPWLHHTAHTMADSIPDRFLAGDQAKSSGSG